MTPKARVKNMLYRDRNLPECFVKIGSSCKIYIVLLRAGKEF